MTQKIHFGSILKEQIQLEERTSNDIAECLNRSVSNLYKIYRRENLDTRILYAVSKGLNKNIFHTIAERFNDELLTSDELLISSKKNTGPELRFLIEFELDESLLNNDLLNIKGLCIQSKNAKRLLIEVSVDDINDLFCKEKICENCYLRKTK
ncbi:MAG: hypothetical protein FWH23_07045 [Bacteroidales bacterium]|nr:hypothetical protein [Bacteroidales bacterium]